MMHRQQRRKTHRLRAIGGAPHLGAQAILFFGDLRAEPGCA
ncbi:hypothetical protein [Arthrobacter rhombi]